MSDTTVTDPLVLQHREPLWSRSLRALLQTELSSYPGRPLLVLRIVFACTFVTFCIMLFRIPGGILGAYTPLLISRDNLHSTKRSALWIACACSAATVEVVLGAMLFAASPFLHLIWVWMSLFAAFYLVSILKVYEAALALGLFVANAIGIWDLPVSSDLRLRQTLFMLMAILLGCIASVVIEYFFARAHPPDAVIEGIQERLTLTEKVLLRHAEGRSDWRDLVHLLQRYSARGTGSLRAFVDQADSSFGERQRISTAVALAGRLVDLSISLIDTHRGCTAADQDLSIAIRHNILLLKENLPHFHPVDWVDIEDGHETCAPVLVEIERTVELLMESFSQSIWEQDAQPHSHHDSPKAGERIVASDAFSTGKHLKFAIRGALSAIACYMFYMSVGWTGLNASIATCILTALPVTGAARHKQLMRFAGVVLGACAFGFAAQIVILPQIDSILSYTLLFASVTFLGAWISTSSPRIAYCGVQIVLAYELVNLGRFSINPSPLPARDTVLGILLGVGAMWLIFDHLWATSSVESIRLLLSATIRQIADLSIPSDTLTSIAREVTLERQTNEIIKSFQKIWTLLDIYIFEAFPKTTSDDVLIRRAKDYLPHLRALLLIKTGLIHHEILSGQIHRSDTATQAGICCTHILHELARKVATDTAISVRSLASQDDQIKERLRHEIESIKKGQLSGDIAELRLSASLFTVSHHLATITS